MLASFVTTRTPPILRPQQVNSMKCTKQLNKVSSLFIDNCHDRWTTITNPQRTLTNGTDSSSRLLLVQQQQQLLPHRGYVSTSWTDGIPPKMIGLRRYSQTRSMLFKRVEDEKDRIIIPNQPEMVYMTTGNTLPPLTEEEALKILEEEEQRLEDEEKAKIVPNWRPGMRKRPLQMSYSLEEFERELEPEKYAGRWNKHIDRRCGALAIKVGMMPLFDNEGWGVRYPCTVLLLDHNIVMGHKTKEKHGYYSVVVGGGERKAKNVDKCVLGQYKHLLSTPSSSLSAITEPDATNGPVMKHPPYTVCEFRVTDPSLLIPITSRIHASHFVPGQNLDVSGISKGKGFQGGMKRHNFSGMPASHGVSRSHREIGSTGSCQDPGKVFKGKKMPGHMGVERVTKQNLRLLQIDRGRNLLYILGAVPGNRGEFVEVRDAVKKPLWNTDKVMDKADGPPRPTFAYDPTIDGTGQGGHEIFMPRPERDPLVPDNEDAAA
jgi:large subunit ribosomal protein L3